MNGQPAVKGESQNEDPIDGIILASVRIECVYEDGATGTGSGFLFKFGAAERPFPVLVTNRHVVEGAVSASVVFHVGAPDNSMPVTDQNCRIDDPHFQKRWIAHPDPTVDLAIIPIADWFTHMLSQGVFPFGRFLATENVLGGDEWEKLRAIEDVVMVGYPNGLWDSENNMPIVRRGITASHPKLNFNGRREFLIDAACFPGSSGSAVYQFNSGAYLKRKAIGFGMRIRLMGVLWGGPQKTVTGEIKVVPVPTKTSVSVETKIPLNLGFVIKADRIMEFLAELEKMGLLPSLAPKT